MPRGRVDLIRPQELAIGKVVSCVDDEQSLTVEAGAFATVDFATEREPFYLLNRLRTGGGFRRAAERSMPRRR